jgi:hypothetical protein
MVRGGSVQVESSITLFDPKRPLFRPASPAGRAPWKTSIVGAAIE